MNVIRPTNADLLAGILKAFQQDITTCTRRIDTINERLDGCDRQIYVLKERLAKHDKIADVSRRPTSTLIDSALLLLQISVAALVVFMLASMLCLPVRV